MQWHRLHAFDIFDETVTLSDLGSIKQKHFPEQTQQREIRKSEKGLVMNLRCIKVKLITLVTGMTVHTLNI